MSKGAIRRLARRGGVKRVSALVYAEARAVLRAFLHNVLRNAVTYAEYGGRTTIRVMDVLHSLKRLGQPMYGFGGFKLSSDRS